MPDSIEPTLPARLARIEAKLDRLIGPPKEIVGLDHVMAITDTHSKSAVFRVLKDLEIKPVSYGKYRLRDLEEAIARRALRARLSAQSQTQ